MNAAESFCDLGPRADRRSENLDHVDSRAAPIRHERIGRALEVVPQEPVISRSARERVLCEFGCRASTQDIVSWSSDQTDDASTLQREGIVPRTTVQLVGEADTACYERVVPGVSEGHVIPRTAVESIRATPTAQGVVPCEAAYDVRLLRSTQHIGACRADDGHVRDRRSGPDEADRPEDRDDKCS
jgi:hypothetical protein